MTKQSYQAVQAAAKCVHKQLVRLITPASTEKSIAETAKQLLHQQGIDHTWYHNTPALVLLGENSCLSISGRDYTPAEQPAGNYNLITVDLSPAMGDIWGDCARSFYLEQGRCSLNPSSSEFQQGHKVQQMLHQAMRKFVTPKTRFSELYQFANPLIAKLGFSNLDFLGNLGHSIESSPEQRRFIDQHCDTALGEVGYFTFEPHIRADNGKWGFKHENIYYFDRAGELKEL